MMNFARKCWRDLRWAWLASAAITAWPMRTAAINLLTPHKYHTPKAESGEADVLLLEINVITALIFSMAIVSRNFAPSVRQHLFSQPRSRAYFIWSAWLTGLIGMLTTWAAAVGVVEVIASIGHDGFPLSALFMYRGIVNMVIVYLLAAGVAYYSISFALGAALGSGWKGAGLALLLWVSYDWRAELLELDGAGRHWPIIGWPLHGVSEPLSFALWMAFSLLLVFAAQLWTQRREA